MELREILPKVVQNLSPDPNSESHPNPGNTPECSKNPHCEICGQEQRLAYDLFCGKFYYVCLKPECEKGRKRIKEERERIFQEQEPERIFQKQEREREYQKHQEQQEQYRLAHIEDDFPPLYRGAQITDCGYEKEIAAWLQNPLPGLLTFLGAAGTGKTRALYSIISHLRTHKKSVENWDVPWLLKHLQVLSHKDIQEEEDEIRQLAHSEATLCLDDLGVEKVTEFTLQDFYMILAEREQWQLPTLLTTNLSLEQIAATLGDRIASRLAGGIVLQFSGKDRRLERK